MKLISTTLGKLIVALAAVTVILVFVAVVFIPKVKEFSSGVLPEDKNYVINSGNSESFKLVCTEDVYEMPVGDSVDIFADITALSSDNEDLLPLLKADFQKPLSQRKHVFVYKINEDGVAVLAEKVDSSYVGEWAVVFVLNDGSERATLKVNYVFLQ